jgi:hypothetical protein
VLAVVLSVVLVLVLAAGTMMAVRIVAGIQLLVGA